MCYFAAPRKLKNAVLFVFSLIFYGWGEPRYIVLMIVSIVSGFVFALMIEKNEEGGDLDGRKKAKGSLCGSFGIFVAKIKYYLQQ